MSHPYFETSGSVPEPMILGHRGAAGCAPENTLLSFERCLDQGADAVESDVQITADGVPVLLHDSDVGRVTEGDGPVEAMTFSELAGLDAGHHFTIDDRGATEPDDSRAFRGQGLRVPSLREAFERFPRARFNLEIKTRAHGAVARVVELVAQLDRAERTLLVAGDDETMRVLREELERQKVEAATSASVAEVVAVVQSAVEGTSPPSHIQALQIPTAFGDRELVTPALLEHAKRHGIFVHVWTINDPKEATRLVELGVDGIVTDFPGRMAGVLKRTARE